MSLAVSDDLEAVPGGGGEGASVQSSGSISAWLKIPILWRSYQNNWFSVSSFVLGHTEAKKTIDVISPEFYNRHSGFQVEGVAGGEDGEEEEEEGGPEEDHVRAQA